MTSFKSVNELATIVRGVSYKPSDVSEIEKDFYIPLLRAMNIDMGQLNFNGLVYVNPKRVKSSQKILKGDVVIAASTGSKKVIGKAAQLNKDWNGTFGAFCLVLRPNLKLIDLTYFGFFFQSDYYRRNISLMSSGANINNLKREYFDRLNIHLPSFDKQKEIAKILCHIDSLKQKRKQAIDFLDEYLRSVFLDMFGNPMDNSKKWELRKFSEIGKLDRGMSKHRPRNSPELLGGDHPLIQTGDVSNAGIYIENYKSTYSDIGLKQSKKWPKGTLCITIAANIAKTGILSFDACFPDSVVGFIADRKQTNNEFIHFWISFLQEMLEKNAPESAQKNINLQILRNLEVFMPPLELQIKFANIVEKSVITRKKMVDQSNNFDQYFHFLMYKHFI